MKILTLHNKYLQPGGEDVVLENEVNLLRQYGHEIESLFVSNEELIQKSPLQLARAGIKTIWAQDSYTHLIKELSGYAPDIIHAHNLFPVYSPSVYWAASKMGVPVVQTLHNYRLTCANGLLLRDGMPCLECVGKVPIKAIKHACYRDSRLATASLASMQVFHRMIGTYRGKVTSYIVLSEFAKELMITSGLSSERIYVKPNFVRDSLIASPLDKRKRQVIFVGRISYEKGLDILLKAWKRINRHGLELVIVGDGSEKDSLQREDDGSTYGVSWKGWLDSEEVKREMSESLFLIAPSRGFEGQPMVLLESLSVGTPIIAPNHGGFPEVIHPNYNGLLFASGDVSDLQRNLTRMVELTTDEWRGWSRNSRDLYLNRFSPEQNYQTLMGIYNKTIEMNRGQHLR